LTGHNRRLASGWISRSTDLEGASRTARRIPQPILLRRLFRILQLKGIAPQPSVRRPFQAVRNYLHLSGTTRRAPSTGSSLSNGSIERLAQTVPD